MSEIRLSFVKHMASDGRNCGVCVAFFKAAVVTALEQQVRTLEADGKDDTAWLTPPAGIKYPPLQEPVMFGTSLMAPVIGPTWLCESHAPAVSQQTSRLALGQGPLPPGLTMGRG